MIARRVYMIFGALLFSVSAGFADEVIPIPTEKSRQFDFWLGDWKVRNSHLQPDKKWRDGGIAKAQIRSVLGGRAILEQWTGQDTLQLRGFSLRTYDAEQQRWEIILNWHSGTPSTFSYMTGNFAEERGEFFPPGSKSVRFTFSDARKDSCTWAQATPVDGGEWRSDWVMKFTRTGPAASLDAETLPVVKPATSVQSIFPASRQLDRLIGIWTGKARRLDADGQWEAGTATRSVTAMIDGFGLLQMTKFSWGEESIAALSFNQQTGQWFEVGMSTNEPDCHWMAGDIAGNNLQLSELPTSNNGFHHAWTAMKTDSFEWTRTSNQQNTEGAAQPIATVSFQRSKPTGRIDKVPRNTPSVQTEIAKAQNLIGQQKYSAAETLLKTITTENKNQHRAYFLLGYAQHIQKKYDDAMSSYQIASKSAKARPTAEYNMACICSIQKKTDEAFEHLDAAVKAGFKTGQIEGDADFDNIRNDPRFTKFLPRKVSDDKLFSEPTRIIHKFVGEAAGDQFGWTARRVGDWDNDGVEDFVSTAPTHAGSGKIYVYSSKSGKLLLEKQGQRGDQFGNSATGAGDVNGDGVPDLIVGAPNKASAGNAYVFSGKDGELLHHFKGQSPGDKFGYEVSELGDIDGDGHADVFVGAAAGDGAQPKSGKAFVYSGATGKGILSLDGERSGDGFGNAAACSLESSGEFVLAIGAQNAGPKKRGRVYVYRVKNTSAKRAFTIEGTDKSVNLGQMFIAFPGDINGDGTADIYASDFSDSTAANGGGRVIVCSGKDGRLLLAINGKRAGEGLGTSPSDAGDVNGDGVGDLVIGAWQNNEGASSGGKVYLHDGATGDLIRTWTCRQSGDTFGFDACGIGDVDGDGAVDFLLTSAWSNTRGPKTGRVFILAGSAKSATKSE